MMERAPTGIPGFDEMCEGGLPRGYATLVAGGAGTGKTIFGMQFLYNGALQYGEPGVMISFEENPRNIMWNTRRFGWDFAELQRQNKLLIYTLGMMGPQKFAQDPEVHLEIIRKLVEEVGAKRLVLDSLSSFSIWMKEEQLIRNFIFRIVETLKELDCTSLLISEIVEGTTHSRFGVEEFIADGVIKMDFKPPYRHLTIAKMRGTKQNTNKVSYAIGDHGIEINPRDVILG